MSCISETCRRELKDYIADFHAIDKLKADDIINEEDVARIKNNLLVKIIKAFEGAVGDS